MKPEVSVIIPVYNVEKYLSRCLDSIVSQDFAGPYEVLIIDDGSTDNSSKIASLYKEKYPHLITLFSKENGGLASARNIGLDNAKGGYILFVDSDDYVEPTYIRVLYSLANSTNSDISMCLSNRCYGNDGEGKLFDSGFNKNFVSIEIETILRRTSFSACNKLYKKNLFSGLRFPIGITYEDFALIPQVMYKASRIAYTHAVLYHYYVNLNSIIMSKINTTNYDIIKAQHILEESCIKDNKSLLGNFYIRRVINSMCFSLLSNENDIKSARKLIAEGKNKYNLAAIKKTMELSCISSIFINLLISNHFYIAFLYAKLIKSTVRIKNYFLGR